MLCFFQITGSVTDTWNVTINACPEGFDPGKKILFYIIKNFHMIL